MHAVLLTLLAAIAFGVPLVSNKNLQLKRTNSLLLKTLKELTAESEVGTNCVAPNARGCPVGYNYVDGSRGVNPTCCPERNRAERAVGGTYEDHLASDFQREINSKDYEDQGDGYCANYRYLDAGQYPALLTYGPMFNKDNRIRECMNRCIGDAYKPEYGRYMKDLGGFFIRNSDQQCACASDDCSSRRGTSGEYHGYKIVDV